MVDARDITDAKQQAREQHINDDGTSNADHIFAYVPDILNVDGWHRHAEGERTYDKEHLWRRDDHNALVYMERTHMGWTVKTAGEIPYKQQDFAFNARKHGEAKLVTLMERHS